MQGNTVRKLIGLDAIDGAYGESESLRVFKEGVILAKDRKTYVNADAPGLTEVIPAFFE